MRVGLEDTVRRNRGELAPSNAAMVEKAARIIVGIGGEMVTVKEARCMLKQLNNGYITAILTQANSMLMYSNRSSREVQY